MNATCAVPRDHQSAISLMAISIKLLADDYDDA